MTALAYKEQTREFKIVMQDAYSIRGAYFILHETANLLEAQANLPHDRNGRPMTPARRKEILAEATAVRNAARPLNN